MTGARLMLGSGHVLRFTSWSPDRDLNPQYGDVADVDPYGAILDHLNAATGQPCSGGLTFEGPTQDVVSPNAPKWHVDIADPAHLTLSPSILCSCGDHGWIRDGRWES